MFQSFQLIARDATSLAVSSLMAAILTDQPAVRATLLMVGFDPEHAGEEV
jgi:hypothetical protein